MWLKTSTDRSPGTTNLRMEEDTYDRIITMGAGVNIVLSDCCNTSVAGVKAEFDEIRTPPQTNSSQAGEAKRPGVT